MSGFVAGAVWNTAMPDRVMKTILACLGDISNEDGFAWPSVETLANRTMYSRRSVIEALGNLESGGWISKEQHPEYHRQNAYRLNFEMLNFSRPKGSYKRSEKPHPQVQSPHLSEDPQVQSTTPSGAIHDSLRCNLQHSQVQSSAPLIGRTVNEPSREPSNEPARVSEGELMPPSKGPTLADLILKRGTVEAGRLAVPVTSPTPDLSDLVNAIVCAHPKALQRGWTAREAPYSAQCETVAAIESEVEKTGCTHAQAAAFILERMQFLAGKIPRGEWRYLKPPDQFMRSREYRLEPEDFSRSTPTPEQPRSFVDVHSEREEETIRELRRKRASERERPEEGTVRTLADPGRDR